MRGGLVALIAAGLLAAGCAGMVPVTATPEPRACDGIPEDLGGCAPGQPVFAGATCDAIAREWGPAVERLVTRVVTEPAVVDGEPRSVRIREAMSLASVRALRRVEAVGLVGECRGDAFLAVAEPAFTPAFRDAVGGHLHDGDPVATWDEFVTELRYASYTFNAASTGARVPDSPRPDGG